MFARFASDCSSLATGYCGMVLAAADWIAALHKLGRSYFRRRYTILFCALAVTLVAAPITSELGLSGIFIESMLAANLLVAVLPVNAGRTRRVLLVVSFLLWIARPVTAWLGHPVTSAIMLGTWVLIALFAAGVAVHFSFSGSKVDAEHLFAALSAYLLAGIYFGVLYWVFEQVQPGAFVTPSGFSRAGACYFSFVTLATLGYGDIVPRADIARGLAVIEGVGGQLFLAVLVARLVSMYSKTEST